MESDGPAWQGKAERAYTQLRDDIESGRLAPGQTLSEIELVEYIGASRTPVREAIRRLATEGLIELAPRRAPTVSRISLRSARALFDYRRLLEPAAITMVAQKAEDNTAVRGAFLSLLERFTQLRAREVTDDFGTDFTDATSEFDELLARHTPNEYLRRAIIDLRPHSARLRNIAHGDRARLGESVAEHIEMCSAIIHADANAAAEAMTRHLHHVDQSIFRRLLNADSELLVS